MKSPDHTHSTSRRAFILSVEDFERTMGCVAAGEINLSAVLKDAVIANQRGDTARMFFSDFIGKYTKRWTLPAVMQDARQAAEARIVAALGGPPGALEEAASQAPEPADPSK